MILSEAFGWVGAGNVRLRARRYKGRAVNWACQAQGRRSVICGSTNSRSASIFHLDSGELITNMAGFINQLTRKRNRTGAQLRRSPSRASSRSDAERAGTDLGSKKQRRPLKLRVQMDDGTIVTVNAYAVQKIRQSVRTIPQAARTMRWKPRSHKQVTIAQKSDVPAQSPVSSVRGELEASDVSKAFKKGFHSFVGEPLGKIQFNLRKMQHSLSRMDKKLARITA